MSPYKRVYGVAFLVFLVCSTTWAWATTIVIRTTNDRIVIASDSKQVETRSGVKISNSKLAKKVVVFNTTTAIGFSGIKQETEISSETGKVAFRFDAVEFLGRIKHTLPLSASISTIDDVIVEELKRRKISMMPYLTSGVFDPNHTFHRQGMEFIIVGYSGDNPVVQRIGIEIDADLGQISDPAVISENASPHRPHIICFGSCGTLRHLMNHGSAEWSAASVRYSAAFGDPDAAAQLADIVRLECEFAPESVAPPIRLTTLLLHHGPIEQTLSK